MPLTITLINSDHRGSFKVFSGSFIPAGATIINADTGSSITLLADYIPHHGSAVKVYFDKADNLHMETLGDGPTASEGIDL